MGFLEAGDRVIVMDINRSTYERANPDYSLKADEMKRLRDAGIRTVLQQMWWDGVERGGRRDWSMVEVGVARAREAGLRVLLQCYQRPPEDLPAAWYMRYQNGESAGHLSFWNQEAADYEEAFVREFAGRYAGEDVLLINSLISDGETMLPLVASWYDPAALASYEAAVGGRPYHRVDDSQRELMGWLRDALLRKLVQYQRLLLEVQEHGEMWLSVHPHIFNRQTGNQFAHEMLETLRGTFPEATVMWLLYTFYEFRGRWCGEQIAAARDLGVELVTGAGHCHGLATSVPAAKESGHRLLCGPRHNVLMPEQVELDDWHVEKLASAVRELGG